MQVSNIIAEVIGMLDFGIWTISSGTVVTTIGRLELKSRQRFAPSRVEAHVLGFRVVPL